jgi:hypothetical protein
MSRFAPFPTIKTIRSIACELKRPTSGVVGLQWEIRI